MRGAAGRGQYGQSATLIHDTTTDVTFGSGTISGSINSQVFPSSSETMGFPVFRSWAYWERRLPRRAIPVCRKPLRLVCTDSLYNRPAHNSSHSLLASCRCEPDRWKPRTGSHNKTALHRTFQRNEHIHRPPNQAPQRPKAPRESLR